MLLLGLLWTMPAKADVDVTIGLTFSATTAPAMVVATATVTATEAVVAFRWTGMGEAPRCRQSRCTFAAPLASCRQLEVEVTTLLGETATATTVACVGDHGVQPPAASLMVTRTSTRSVEINGLITAGDAPIAIERLWIDDQPIAGSSTRMALTPGCHAVDWLVADEAGYIGVAQRSVCIGADTPRLWLGGVGGACPELGASYRLCGEVTHPLGLDVTRVAGDVPLDACTGDRPAPTRLTRVLVRGQDPTGVESVASLFTCGAPNDGPRSLLFLRAPDEARSSEGEGADIVIDVLGGVSPFVVTARSDGQPDTVLDTNDASPVLRLPARPPGRYAITLGVTDARGLEDQATLLWIVDRESPATDAGVLLDARVVDGRVVAPQVDGGPAFEDAFDARANPPSFGANSSAAGCSATGASDSTSLWILACLLCIARRRCR